jgi:hypothetical protein
MSRRKTSACSSSKVKGLSRSDTARLRLRKKGLLPRGHGLRGLCRENREEPFLFRGAEKGDRSDRCCENATFLDFFTCPSFRCSDAVISSSSSIWLRRCHVASLWHIHFRCRHRPSAIPRGHNPPAIDIP